MRFHGQCHCGNISFTYEVSDAEAQLPVKVCICSFCRKHGGLYTTQPDGILNATFEDGSAVTRYRFGTNTADFYICNRCSIVPFVTCEIDGNLYATVNINALEDLDVEKIAPLPVDLDDESLEERIARRKRNWAAEVNIAG